MPGSDPIFYSRTSRLRIRTKVSFGKNTGVGQRLTASGVRPIVLSPFEVSPSSLNSRRQMITKSLISYRAKSRPLH